MQELDQMTPKLSTPGGTLSVAFRAPGAMVGVHDRTPRRTLALVGDAVEL